MQNGMINLEDTRKQIEEMKKEEAFAKHQFSIWRGKNGKYYTYLPDKNAKDGRRQVTRKTYKALKDIVSDFYMEAEANPTIQDVFYEWMHFKKDEICKGTIDRYNYDFGKYFKTNQFCERKIKYVTEDDLEEFIRKIIVDFRLTHKSFSNARTLIYGIFKYAKKKHLTDISISSFIKDLELSERLFQKKIIYKEKEVFNEEEIPMLINYLEQNSDNIRCLGILLILYTGLRVGELSTIKESDIVGRTLHIQRTEVRYKDYDTGKYVVTVKEYPKSDAGVRYVILTNEALHVIERIKKISSNKEYLLENEHGERIRGHCYTFKLYKICHRLGINSRSVHKVRKTYITNLLDSKVDEALVAEQVGHANIETTKKYYYFSNKSMKSKLEQLNEADRQMVAESIRQIQNTYSVVDGSKSQSKHDPEKIISLSQRRSG